MTRHYPKHSRNVLEFDLDDKYIPIIQEQIDLLKHVENNNLVRKAIAVLKNPKLCNVCAENKYSYAFGCENLCLDCFEHRYGEILLASSAEYYGGHKAYLGGGAFTKFQTGLMYLTENYLIFIRRDKDETRSWEIIIPLNSYCRKLAY